MFEHMQDLYTHLRLFSSNSNKKWVLNLWKKTVACMHSWMHNDITKTLLNAKACTKLEVNDQLT